MSDDAHDIGAEQALLGSVLSDAEAAAPAFLAVPEDAWYRPKHGEIAAVISGRLRRSEKVDPQLVLVELLGRQGFGSDTGPYLATLNERAWNVGHAADYADRIMRCWARRGLALAALRLRQRLDQSWVNGYDEAIGEFTRDLRTVCDQVERADAGILHDQPSMTLAELLDSDIPSRPLVPGLLDRAERIILTGGEGHGKSVLTAQFASCLAAGLHPFTAETLGAGDRAVRVLVVDCENNQAQSQRRFRRVAEKIDRELETQRRPAGDWRKNLTVELRPGGIDLLEGPDAGWLERRVALNAPDLLVIGPIYLLHVGDMNNELMARQLIHVIDGIRTRHDCSILTEAHAGHAEDSGRNRKLRPAGSSLFMRWPEFGYGLARAKNAVGEHPNLVDVVAWRGSREERQWPGTLEHGKRLPWWPADQEYFANADAAGGWA